MADVLDWQGAADPRAVVARAVQALGEGRIVAFPTETVYGLAANAFMPEAIERLRQCKGRPEDKPLTLALGTPEDILDWVPGVNRLGRRLARRCWPGPVTLVFSEGLENGRLERLPESARRGISPTGTLGLRVPAHVAILEALDQLPAPLALTSANRAGEPEAVTADQVVDAVGHELAIVIDDGACRYGQPSTVVQVAGNACKVLREGVISARELSRLSASVIVFVCTGNTCRSPLAEALCKKLLAERLGCTPAELPERGFIVLSAGLAAMIGGSAAEQAVEVAREYGTELIGHRSRLLTADLVAQADYLVAMTRGHRLAVEELLGPLDPQPRLLGADGEDIADPVGRDKEVYRECAQQIQEHLGKLLAEFQQS